MKKTKFIAEIGSNHNQDWKRCLALIEKAKEIGCDGIKLQYFSAEKLWHPSMVKELESAKDAETPFAFIQRAKSICKDLGLIFGCSVFHSDDVKSLKDQVDYLKVSSFEINNIKLLEEMSLLKKDLHFSLGLKSIDEDFLNRVRYDFDEDSDKVLYHCVSQYPAKSKHVFLKRLQNIMSRLGNYDVNIKIGYSDHTAEPGVIYQAVACGAEYIECHLDLEDQSGNEFKHGHCWHPAILQRVIDEVRIGEQAYDGHLLTSPYLMNSHSQMRGDWD